MQRLKTFALMTAIFLVVTMQNVTIAKAYVIKIDFTGTANNIIDGDTFDVTAVNGTQYRIRLADVDASERGEAGYTEAKEYLSGLVYGKIVYLDVDDLYVWDDHGAGSRLVCVIYVNYNSTHLLNVNQALVQAVDVEKKNYDNEFNPYTWSLYIPKEQAIPEFPPATILALAAIATIMLAVLLKRKPFGERARLLRVRVRA